MVSFALSIRSICKNGRLGRTALPHPVGIAGDTVQPLPLSCSDLGEVNPASFFSGSTVSRWCMPLPWLAGIACRCVVRRGTTPNEEGKRRLHREMPFEGRCKTRPFSSAN